MKEVIKAGTQFIFSTGYCSTKEYYYITALKDITTDTAASSIEELKDYKNNYIGLDRLTFLDSPEKVLALMIYRGHVSYPEFPIVLCNEYWETPEIYDMEHAKNILDEALETIKKYFKQE